MKKIYLFFIVCFFSKAGAQIINFPDANFKARLLSAEVGNGIAYSGGGSFKVDSNNDNEIEVSEALLVNHLVLYNCGISDLSGLEYFVNLKQLNCANNAIAALDLTPFPNLVGFDAHNNQLSSLVVSNLPLLTNFSCNNNQLVSLTVSNLASLHTIFCDHNQLTAIDVSQVSDLLQLSCSHNLLTQLDVSNLQRLSLLRCTDNNLNAINMKNGAAESDFYLDFSNNPNLEYICADDFQLTQIADKIAAFGYTNCHVNSYCAFVQGGDFYSINGSIRFDETNDGCDASAIAFPDLKLSVSDGTHIGTVIGNAQGQYHFSVQAGTHTIEPLLANPAYFNVSPSLSSVTFPTATGLQDFCITPNGTHPDLEISFEQTDGDYAALPGWFNHYLIRYTNKGTVTQSGSIALAFDEAIWDYTDANPAIASQSPGSLSWNFIDLKPFESRNIAVTLHLNSFQDLPAVNEGDPIAFSASVNTIATDDTPQDNVFTLNQLASYIILLGTKKPEFANYFVLYPNPADQILHIEDKVALKKESVKVYAMTGQLVIDITAAQDLSTVEVSRLKAGNYFIVIATDRGVFKSRFIKK